MRTPLVFGSCALLAVGLGLSLGSLGAGCSGTALTGGGGAGSTSTSGTGGTGGVPAGEICTDPPPNLLKARFIPAQIILPACTGDACASRSVRLVVDPDTCQPSPVNFTTGDKDVAQAPSDTGVELHKDDISVDIKAGTKIGTTKITATVHVKDPKNNDIGMAVATIDVITLAPTMPTCTGTASTGALKGGDTVSLGSASIGLPVGADNPDQGSFLWGVTPFPATIDCGTDITPSGFTALGPAIKFGPDGQTFQREIPMQVPINPALMPSAARLRHVKLAYSGPAFKKPRVIPVADAHIVPVGDGYALSFKAPRLGTYQAVVKPDAGTKVAKRRMTHRAVMGISMGGGGTATFGFRHHDLFDVMAPLGGPVDWTWMLNYIEHNHLGGFRSIPKGTTLKDIQLTPTACMTGADCKTDETCLGVIQTPATPGKCVLLPKVSDPYAHAQTFNQWWYEYPRSGNGGTFDRRSYSQIFRDLALMYGNPNSDNLTPGAENLPAGVRPDDPTVVGDHPGNQCAVWVDPIDGDPDFAHQQELDQTCAHERCSHTLSLSNYFDDEYNPDGIFPVITVCDGSPQNQDLTPWSNTWTPNGNDYPLEVGLAVDYNGNGVRDEMEPIIRAGHEPWRDDGTDGIPSASEPGYMAGVNDDPNGDDYNAQYNPVGTEGDGRYQQGEHFDDFGLDGVPNTLQQPAGGWQKPGDGYDVGEGDGKFTATRGLQRFWDRDAHSIVRQMVDPAKVPGGDMSDAALSRVDMWTDGGLRDLFNFGVDAQHLVGAFSARGRDTAYLTYFSQAPGLDPSQVSFYDPKLVDYDDLPGVVLQRYGHIDPNATDIDNGSGQHVGNASEITNRLYSAFYFIASRWRDRAELRARVDTSVDPMPGCDEGSLTITFPDPSKQLGPSGRRGPVGISLPPGYCSPQLQHIRYPVIYLLHGYGQNPQDLEATIILLRNQMNDGTISSANRLAKAIIVYVDGRCRENADGSAECLRGTFFSDSVRKGGAQDESWWLELMDYMDQNYRTLGETQVDWTE